MFCSLVTAGTSTMEFTSAFSPVPAGLVPMRRFSWGMRVVDTFAPLDWPRLPPPLPLDAFPVGFFGTLLRPMLPWPFSTMRLRRHHVLHRSTPRDVSDAADFAAVQNRATRTTTTTTTTLRGGCR